MRRNRWGLLASLTLAALPGAAGGQVVRGMVTDPALGAPVPEALVIMVNEAGERIATVFTTTDGQFSLDVPGQGSYMVGVTRIGYQQAMTPQFAVAAEDVSLEIHLPVDPVALDEVMVESTRNTPDAGRLRGFLPDERHAGTLIGRLTRAEIDAMGPSTDMVGLLARMSVPGLRARRVPLSIGGPSSGICVEAGRNRSVVGKTASAIQPPTFNDGQTDPTGASVGNVCHMAAVYMNGLYVSDPADILAGLTTGDIDQVQAVAPLEALARFGGRAANGALLIWTRTGRE